MPLLYVSLLLLQLPFSVSNKFRVRLQTRFSQQTFEVLILLRLEISARALNFLEYRPRSIFACLIAYFYMVVGHIVRIPFSAFCPPTLVVSASLCLTTCSILFALRCNEYAKNFRAFGFIFSPLIQTGYTAESM